jgi:hypothetical protein
MLSNDTACLRHVYFLPDTSIAELIKEHTDTESFRENLQVQHGKHSCLFELFFVKNYKLDTGPARLRCQLY